MRNEKEIREFVWRAICNARGDDLHRAKAAFRGLTAEQMQEQHGQSGQTRQHWLDVYQAHDDLASDAQLWFNQLPTVQR